MVLRVPYAYPVPTYPHSINLHNFPHKSAFYTQYYSFHAWMMVVYPGYTGSMSSPHVTAEQLKLWRAPRIDPPIPRSWPIPEMDRPTVERRLMACLLVGESDIACYTEVFEPFLDDGEGHVLIPPQKLEEYAQALLASRRAYAKEIGIEGCRGNLVCAFEALERTGIIAYPDGNWCGIPEEGPEDGTTRYGYVSLSAESAEALLLYDAAQLHCGTFSDTGEVSDQEIHDADCAIIQNRIIPVLEGHGVEVKWNGTAVDFPLVTNTGFFAIP